MRHHAEWRLGPWSAADLDRIQHPIVVDLSRARLGPSTMVSQLFGKRYRMSRNVQVVEDLQSDYRFGHGQDRVLGI